MGTRPDARTRTRTRTRARGALTPRGIAALALCAVLPWLASASAEPVRAPASTGASAAGPASATAAKAAAAATSGAATTSAPSAAAARSAHDPASASVRAAPDYEPLREPLDRFPHSALRIRSGERVHEFRVWIADTFPRREQGLMWVKKLAPDRGMLFVFEQPQLASFWMKNTYVPLDLLFVAPNGRVIRIAENATPHSLEGIGSMGYVTGVLELPGGTAQRLSLRAGDVVLHPAFARR